LIAIYAYYSYKITTIFSVVCTDDTHYASAGRGGVGQASQA